MRDEERIKATIERIVGDAYSDEDLRLLRSLVRRRGGANAVQLGKYSIRLDNGRNIHIGDRVYRGADAEAIRDVLQDLADDMGEDVPRGSLRSFGGFIVALGTLVSIVGLAVFAANFLSVWGDGLAGSGPRRPSSATVENLVLGFGTAFAGGLITAFGNLVRGLERRRGR
ncbi:hypothetical protein [Streptosporangium fragile]